jgi:hypothetical protein
MLALFWAPSLRPLGTLAEVVLAIEVIVFIWLALRA